MKTNIKGRITWLLFSKTTIMVNKRETIYLITSISDKRLYSFFISLVLSFFFFLYLLFSYLFRFNFVVSERNLHILIDNISGRNFLSSFGHFWVELVSRWGLGGARAPSAPPLRTRLALHVRLLKKHYRHTRSNILDLISSIQRNIGLPCKLRILESKLLIAIIFFTNSIPTLWPLSYSKPGMARPQSSLWRHRRRVRVSLLFLYPRASLVSQERRLGTSQIQSNNSSGHFGFCSMIRDQA